ncbi:PspC domain-containing protein [Pseudonocardia spinosispora]|uniref:PspC domain-containing protein n=1 Tax=Pseudonocardia spinosispora TaxID=103441 RepID=UPI0012EC7B7D
MDETATTTGPKQATDTDTGSTTEASTEVLPRTDDDSSPTTRLPTVDDSPTTQLPATEEADSPIAQLPSSTGDDGPTTEVSPTPPSDGVSRDDSPTDVLHPATPPSAKPAVPTPELTAGTASDDATTAAPPTPDLLSTKLRRSKDDKMISGVCGGFAKTLGIDPLWLRLGLIVAVLLGFGVGLIVYLACWILMPLED